MYLFINFSYFWCKIRILKRILLYIKGILGCFYYKKTYSQYAEDIILENLFKLLNIKKGFYVDVGAFHPIYASNTHKLYKKGWRGINIEGDKDKMFLFNLFRRKDTNINVLVNNQDNVTVEFYKPKGSRSYGSMSSIIRRDGYESKNQFKSYRLSTILKPYNIKHIDLLSIDLEGIDEKIILDFDFEEYKPDIMIVESYKIDIDLIIESDVYKLLKSKEYFLFSWASPSLIFLSRKIHDKLEIRRNLYNHN